MNVRVMVLTMMVLLLAKNGYACLFDTDCLAVGSTCIKEEGSLNGVCKGGLGSGNAYNEERPSFFPSLDRTHVDTCSFDTDCEVDQRCEKKIGTIYGVCMTSDQRQDDRY